MVNPEGMLPSDYEGYASCPLFTGDDRLMLAEFKYGGIPDETFFKDQERPRKIFLSLIWTRRAIPPWAAGWTRAPSNAPPTTC